MRFTTLYILGLLLLAYSPIYAQLITSDPAAPTVDQSITIVFDATEGTAGLADCNCDVYIHTGLITDQSTGPSDWQHVPTAWGQVNPDWQLTPVPGEPNKYSYTFSPTVLDYFNVPMGENVERLAMVFRNGDGSLEGKADGGSDIFIDLFDSAEFNATITSSIEEGELLPLGKTMTFSGGATQSADLRIFDNDVLVASTTGVEISEEFSYSSSDDHTIRFEAETEDGTLISRTLNFTTELVVEFTMPTGSIFPADPSETFDYFATSYLPIDLTVNSDGTTSDVEGGVAEGMFTVGAANGIYQLSVSATHEGEMAGDTLTFIVGGPSFQPAPAGFERGITVTGPNSVHLQLFAPGKSDVFVVGNFNDWTPTLASRMFRGTDSGTFWINLDNIEVEDLIFQYLVDFEIQVADPYSTLVLNSFDDNFINESVFADIPDYPNRGEGPVSWVRMNPPTYDWQVNDFTPVDEEQMVVYELLLRDFFEEHSYTALEDTLDYLERLGINAIELMPVNEFEGNISWGYNPNFHMALDKYYGSPEAFKSVVDACHARGIAVIVDVVFNHAFSTSPLCQLWWDQDNFRPSPDNPYLNVTPRHPFNVGYDFNHESQATRRYVKRCIEYFLEEYRIDGYRFDLSKGFTQVNYGDNVGAWSNYDASRIAIIKDYADEVWAVNPDAYVIMEHLAVSTEEDELAQYGNGMYFWSGFSPHDPYLEAAMGFGGNLSEVFSENRGFTGENLVAYIESHDEERLIYKTNTFGNSSGSYNTQDLATGLERSALAAAFFYTVPGPKMLWQFGELGYDFSINYCPGGGIDGGCRTDPKPIRWDYREDPNRQALYNSIRGLLYLRNNYGTFHTDNYDYSLNGNAKRIHLIHPDFDAAIVGNFDVNPTTLSNPFPSAGTWYDYFTGESIEVSDPNAAISLEAGEYHVYLSEDIELPGGGLGATSVSVVQPEAFEFELSPNPSVGPLMINFKLDQATTVQLDLLDIQGRHLSELASDTFQAGDQQLSLDLELPAQSYLIRLQVGNQQATKLLVIR